MIWNIEKQTMDWNTIGLKQGKESQLKEMEWNKEGTMEMEQWEQGAGEGDDRMIWNIEEQNTLRSRGR